MEDDNTIPAKLSENEDFIIGSSTEFQFANTPLYKSVTNVCEGLSNDLIPEQYIKAIYDLMPDSILEPQEYDEKFNLRDELTMQIQYVRGLRGEIFDKKGRLRKGYDIDDAKHILTASRDLVKILQNSHDQLLTHDRMQAIEMAFIDTVAEMSEEEREKFADLLETYLERHEPE